MELQTGWEREMRKRGKMSRRNNSEEKKKDTKTEDIPELAWRWSELDDFSRGGS